MNPFALIPAPYRAIAPYLLIVALAIGLVLTRSTLSEAKANHRAELLAIKERTAQVYAIAAGNALAKERMDAAQSRKSADEHARNYTALSARYDRMWAKLSPGGAGRPARVPTPSEAASRASEGACGQGFWCLSTADAVSIMFHADANTLQLMDLLAWHRAQEASDAR